VEHSEFRELIETVRERTDIVQVVGERIALDRYGRALCPFHKETDPSFHVHRQRQCFHCFGCGVGGDVFTFLELYEHKPFLKVLQELAEKAGVPLPVPIGDAAESATEERLIQDILTEAARFYHGALTPAALTYLREERGYSDEIIKRFRLGWSAGGLRSYLTEERGFPVEKCLKAGVLRRTDQSEVRDYFKERLIFPNMRRGRAVHLSGRRLDGAEPKYLHLPGRIEYLYNEDSLAADQVILTEGPTDCISAIQAGYEAVAVLGVANLRSEHADNLSKCLTVNVCFDGDDAGRKGALKAVAIIGERAQIVELPERLDLNDFLRQHSRQELDELISRGKDLIEYEISLIPADTPKTRLPQALEPLLKRLAELDGARSESYLSYAIKRHFGLKREDIDGYRSVINNLRKKAAADETSQATSEEAYTAVFDGLVDLVEYEGQPAFLVKDDDGLAIKKELVLEGKPFRPPPKEQIPWLLPRGDEVLDLAGLSVILLPEEQDGALYDDLIRYHKSVSELPDDAYYDLIVAWELHTYLLEDVQYSPIICLFAVPERGKSRTGKAMIYLAHRGVHVESLRDSYLVRIARDLQASVFFDVKNVWQKAERNGSEDILLHRFEKGARVPRVLYPERGAHKDIVYYLIFGPTVIATNTGVHRILETRAIQINMPEASRGFEQDVTPEATLTLKERLVAFRSRHLGKPLPDVEKPAKGRLGDILKPLRQIIRLVNPDREGAFMGLVKELEAKRMLDKSESLEAQVLATVLVLGDIVENGILANKGITEALNADRSERSNLSPHRVGRVLSAMGFAKGKTSTGASAIIWNEKTLCLLADRYGLKQRSVTSETSVIPLLGGDDADLTDDTELSRTLCEEVPRHGYSDTQE